MNEQQETAKNSKIKSMIKLLLGDARQGIYRRWFGFNFLSSGGYVLVLGAITSLVWFFINRF